MVRSRKMSGGQAANDPPWLVFIKGEYAKVQGGGKKSTYLNEIVSYFTGGGSQYYPDKTGNGLHKVDTNNSVFLLDEDTLNSLELVSLDPRRIAMQQCIQQNLVENAATSPNRFADMKGPMDALKNDSRFGKSEYFDNYPKEERDVWNSFHIPVLSSKHPVIKELNNIKSSNQKPTGGPDWTRYYNAVLNFTDFFNKFYGLLKKDLTSLELPTYDRRRLQLSAFRQSFKDSLCTDSPQSGPALKEAMAPFLADPDKSPPSSWPLTSSEKDAYSSIPTKQCSPTPEPILSGGGRRRLNRKTRRRRGSRRH
jgi:hypothetical protein